MWVETQPSAQSSLQKLNVDNSCQKAPKIRYYIFEALPNFTVFHYSVPNILPRIKIALEYISLIYIGPLGHPAPDPHIRPPALIKF